MGAFFAMLVALAAVTLPPRPPARLSISVPRTAVAATGGGVGGFIGLTPLPEDEQNHSLVPDPSGPVLAYFREATHDPCLELQLQSLVDEADGEQRFAFVQSCHGVPILGTYALAQLHDGMLHYARHYLIQTPGLDTIPRVTAAAAQAAALAASRSFATGVSLGQGAPALAILHQDDAVVLVWSVPVATEHPFSTWDIFIDARTRKAVGRDETAMRALTTGTVTAMVELRCEGDRPTQVALSGVEYARGLATEHDGGFRAIVPTELATLRVAGPYFRVIPFEGQPWEMMTKLHPSPAFNELAMLTAPFSHVDPFYYATQARAWLRMRLAEMPDMAAARVLQWTEAQMPLRVDLPSGYQGFSCNAYYDGTGLNFYEANPQVGCLNSGRVAKIVFHEYGHGVHDHLTWSRATFDAQVSEGAADYIAATMTDDPRITGLMGCEKVLTGRTTQRTCENHYTYCRGKKCQSHPRDEVHNAAPVLCGALWEIRQELGAEAGDHLFLRFLTLATDMDSAYEAAIAADEDDDDDPTNGTAHSCAINRAFLGDGTTQSTGHFPDARPRALPCVEAVYPAG